MKKNNKNLGNRETGFIRDSVRWLLTGTDSFSDEAYKKELNKLNGEIKEIKEELKFSKLTSVEERIDYRFKKLEESIKNYRED